MPAPPISASLANAAFFARRTPLALYRRAVGKRYLQRHPELERTYEPPDADAVSASISALAPALAIERIRVDRAGYDRWVRDARYPVLAYHTMAEEKFLEHYLSVVLLGSRAAGAFIDVASCRSFFPELMRRRGFAVTIQDLSYAPGLHGDRLGCNAAAFPLADGSVDAMTLHCSFEHFEGDADNGFVCEAGRILRPGGIVVIIPLYLHTERIIWSDPYFLSGGYQMSEPGAVVPAVSYGNRFGRMYDPAAFVERVYGAVRATDLKATLWQIENASVVSPRCYVKFALTLEKPAAAGA